MYSLADGKAGFFLMLVPCWLSGATGDYKRGKRSLSDSWRLDLFLNLVRGAAQAPAVPAHLRWLRPVGGAVPVGRPWRGSAAAEGRASWTAAAPRPVCAPPAFRSFTHMLRCSKLQPMPTHICWPSASAQTLPQRSRALPVFSLCQANRCPRCWLLFLQLPLKGRFLSAPSSLWAGWGV